MMRLLKIDEAATMLGVHPNTVRGLLPKLGAVDLSGGKGKRLIRIPEEGILSYIRDCVITPVTPMKKRKATQFKLERRKA